MHGRHCKAELCNEVPEKSALSDDASNLTLVSIYLFPVDPPPSIEPRAVTTDFENTPWHLSFKEPTVVTSLIT